MDKARILIVEDELIVADSIARILKMSGYSVCSIASSAEEALQKEEKLKPDLILMDIILSNGDDGITVAEQISSHSYTPIIYMSALTDDTNLERAKRTGPYGYIVKPFNARELIHAVEIALYKYSMEIKLRDSEVKYRSIFDNALEGIFQSTMEGRLLDANPAFAHILGYESPEEIMSDMADMDSRFYVYPEKRKEFLQLLAEQVHINNFEVEYYRKNRDIIWVSIDGRIAKDKKNNISYIEGMLEDITSRKKADLEIKDALERVRRAMTDIIDVIVNAVEMRDPYTAGHQKRVAHLAQSIANEMGLLQDRIEGTRMAGYIHDLGKISIPAEILSMPRSLTDIEYQFVQTHSQAGYEILKDIDFQWPIAQIILQHHERIDGSGYPQGLKNGEILLESRIIAVADVVEAIVSHRPYRPAYGMEAALDEIDRNREILYDGEVVDACIRLFREKNFHL
jgi:PAS domain S-box-containing protein/putative nucleotidyltransferase with HDIG domain